jgi:predicted Zn-dependent peptidase
MIKPSLKSLPNGSQLLLSPSRDALTVTAAICLSVGSRNERAGEEGVAHFIEHLLFKGTKRWPSARSLAEAVEGVGAEFNAATSYDKTLYYIRCGKEEAAYAIEVLLEMVLNPLFDPIELERERSVIIEEINGYADEMDEVAHESARNLLWPDHPMGKPILGSENSISSVPLETIISFHQRGYNASHMTLALGGAIDEDIMQFAEQKLMTIETNQTELITTLPPEEGTKRVVLLKREEAYQTQLAFTLPATSQITGNQELSFVCDLLIAILGGGMSSRLFQSVRENKGLAYSIYSHYSAYASSSVINIEAGVDRDRAEEAIKTILDEIDILASQGISQEELDRVRRFVKGEKMRGYESQLSRLFGLHQSVLVWGKMIDIEDYLEGYDRVSAEQINDLAKKLLQRSEVRLAVVGNIPPGLEIIL